MMTGAHAIIYRGNAEADRAFLHGELGVYQPSHPRP
jgi:hypothetical protein